MIKLSFVYLWIFVLIVFTWLCKQEQEANANRSLSSTYSQSLSDCISYEDNSNYKWCRAISSYSSGYFWSNEDTSNLWGGTSEYIWSDNKSQLPKNSKRFLCPQLSSQCGTQTFEINQLSDINTIKVDSLSANSIWWFRFKSKANLIKSISFTLKKTDDIDVDIYLEKSNSKFEYKGRLTSSSFGVNTESDQYAIWVLMTPEWPKTSYSSFIAEPSLSEVSTKSRKSKTMLIVLILWLVGGGLLVIAALIAISIFLFKKYRKVRIDKYSGPDTPKEKNKQSKTEVLDKDDQLTIGEERKDDVLYSLPNDLEGKGKYFNNGDWALKDIDINRNTGYKLNEFDKMPSQGEPSYPSLSHLQHFEATVSNVWYKFSSKPTEKDQEN